MQQILPWVPSIETFGVEIEVISKGTRERIANEISHYGFAAQSRDNAAPDHPYDRWYVKRDTTISHEAGYTPAELVSPILDESTIDANIEVACEVLEHTESKVNESCGLHIHLSDKWLGLEEKKRIAWNYIKNEETIDLLILPNRRESKNMTCQGWKNKDKDPWEHTKDYQDDIAKAQDTEVLRAIVNPKGRYYKLNLAPHEKQTIEFRQHHGTVEAEDILMWKKFVTAFVQYSITKPVSGGLSKEQLPNMLESFAEHVDDEPETFTSYYSQRANEFT